ncbi:Ase1p [Sporobolomyces koalae]|uniref:Ase1p n=1 Tax=Sporobolomyces koalae TaxID=500713 RepID=UPI00316FD9C4
MTTTLERLVSDHSEYLSNSYHALVNEPVALREARLKELELVLKREIDKQTSLVQAELDHARTQLEQAYTKANGWLAALGEPSIERKDDERDVSFERRNEQVETELERLRSRVQRRGEQVVELEKELRGLSELVSIECPLTDQDTLDRGWEELDLTQDRINLLECEIARCRQEIIRRQEQINLMAAEIAGLHHDLGPPLPTGQAGENPPREEEDSVLEQVWLHLGIGGKDRKSRIELSPTTENVERLELKAQALTQERSRRHEEIQLAYDKLYPLWTMLGVAEEDMDLFVNQWCGSTLESIAAYHTELDRMMSLRRSNLSSFIHAERESLTQLWDQLYLSHAERVSRFPAFTISVDPIMVWNDELGFEQETVNDNVSEELLIRHEREREKVQLEVEDAKLVLERLARYFEVVQKAKDLEAAAADPSRLTARGSSTKLLLEERDRKRVAKEKPKLEADLRALIPEWEAKHRRPFLVDGVPFIESLDEQQRAQEMEKENKRRTKLGTSGSGSARPLRAQPTGATTTVAPLKRQMTGASSKSNASSSSASGHPPPAKRQVAMTTGSSTHSSGYSHPSMTRPKSVLGMRNQFVAGAATPATGSLARSRSNTVAGRDPITAATPTPSTGAGMRLPTGWAAGTSIAATPVQPSYSTGRVIPASSQRSGHQFRPRPSTQTR